MKFLRRLDAWEDRHPVLSGIIKGCMALIFVTLAIFAAYGWSLIVR